MYFQFGTEWTRLRFRDFGNPLAVTIPPSEPPYNQWTTQNGISVDFLFITVSFMFLIIFQAITVLFSFLFTWNIYVLHLRFILNFFIAFILIPKYFINQNENLKLYVSVYHWVPAPILPWQLLENNIPNSVNLICVKYPKNE